MKNTYFLDFIFYLFLLLFYFLPLFSPSLFPQKDTDNYRYILEKENEEEEGNVVLPPFINTSRSIAQDWFELIIYLLLIRHGWTHRARTSVRHVRVE